MTTRERLLRIFDDYIRTLRILTRGAPTRTERYSDGQGADQLHNCWRHPGNDLGENGGSLKWQYTSIRKAAYISPT
jgi:hypothetical protein